MKWVFLGIGFLFGIFVTFLLAWYMVKKEFDELKKWE